MRAASRRLTDRERVEGWVLPGGGNGLDAHADIIYQEEGHTKSLAQAAAEWRLGAAGSAANEENPPRRATFTLEHILEQALPRGRVVADPTTQGELLGSRLSLRIRRPRLVAGVRLLSAPRGFLTHDRC